MLDVKCFLFTQNSTIIVFKSVAASIARDKEIFCDLLSKLRLSLISFRSIVLKFWQVLPYKYHASPSACLLTLIGFGIFKILNYKFCCVSLCEDATCLLYMHHCRKDE